MTEQIDVLKMVADRLERASVAYMLTGSMASSYYAEPRFTRDVDVVVDLSAADVVRVSELFEADFYVDADAIAAAVARSGMVNLIHTDSVVKVDLIIRKAAPHFVEEFERRRRVHIEGTALWIVSPEDLIISKLLWLEQVGRSFTDAISDPSWRRMSSWTNTISNAPLIAWGCRRSGVRRPVRIPDTSDTASNREYRRLLQQRSGSQRVAMASGMFDTARRMVLASLPADVREDPLARRIALLRRFYGRDLGAGTLAAATAHIRHSRELRDHESASQNRRSAM